MSCLIRYPWHEEELNALRAERTTLLEFLAHTMPLARSAPPLRTTRAHCRRVREVCRTQRTHIAKRLAELRQERLTRLEEESRRNAAPQHR